MQVTRQRAQFIPALNSYFITDYNEQVVQEIKATRENELGGDKYIGKNVWEVSEEVWSRIKHNPHTLIDRSVKSPTPFVLTISEDIENRYDYQIEAAEEMKNRKEALLFFDTGTGKTRTTLLALSRLSKDLSACIVVGEANLSEGWKDQVRRYFPESESRFIVLNDGRNIPARIDAIKSSAKGTIFIINIEAIRNKKVVDALNKRRLAVVVLDECQCIIGYRAQQTEGMHSLESDFRWALSATPIKNSPLEWYSLLAWLRVIPFKGAKTRFKQYYSTMELNKFKQSIITGYRNEDDLEDLKNLVTMRVEKKGLGLPTKYDKDVLLPLQDHDLKELLARIHSEKKQDWIDLEVSIAGTTFRADTLAGLFYLEMLAVSTARNKVSFLDAYEKEPIIVVSRLKYPLDYIHSIHPEESVLYHGDIPQEERARNLSAFKKGEKRILLMTRKSGGTGLDGLQFRASKMFFLDAPHNKADYNQCADRIHRIGQEKEVTIFRLILEGTLDVYAWENIEEKQSWIDRYYKVNYEENLIQ